MRIGKINIDKNLFVKESVKVFAPTLLSNKLGELLEGKSIAQAYVFFDSTNSLWDILPESDRTFLSDYRPWKLDWLTLEWVIDAMGKYNSQIAYLLGTSPELQGKINIWIEETKNILEEEL